MRRGESSFVAIFKDCIDGLEFAVILGNLIRRIEWVFESFIEIAGHKFEDIGINFSIRDTSRIGDSIGFF